MKIKDEDLDNWYRDFAEMGWHDYDKGELCTDPIEDLRDAREQIKTLKKALEFYENIKTYQGDWNHCPIWQDLGIKAHEALDILN